MDFNIQHEIENILCTLPHNYFAWLFTYTLSSFYFDSKAQFQAFSQRYILRYILITLVHSFIIFMKALYIEMRYQSADMTFTNMTSHFRFLSLIVFQCSVCNQPMFAWFHLLSYILSENLHAQFYKCCCFYVSYAIILITIFIVK